MASSPTLPQDSTPDPNTLSQNPNNANPDQIQQTLPDDDDDTQFPKTLTLEIPNPNSQEDDPTNQNHDDFEDLTLFSPTTTTTTTSRRAGGGRKSRKANQKRRVQVKKSEKKLETLSQTLNPIPFVPNKILDLASHETLLKKLGLWEFVHLQFDTNIRADLLAQLIAGYNPAMRGSYVNEVKIMVNRADLGRALKLPVKKEKGSVGDGASEVTESAESIGFIEELVSNWILLHEDTWKGTLQPITSEAYNLLAPIDSAIMASPRALHLVCLAVCIMVMTASTTKASVSCNQVINTLTPCLSYVVGNGALTDNCCNGIRGLNSAARTTPDRQSVCTCLKNTASQFSYNSRNVALAAGLPGKCGVKLPYKIDPSTDCKSVK